MSSPVREAIDLLSKSGEAAFAIDSTDRIVYWNKEAERLLGFEAQKVLGKHCFDVMGGRDDNGNVYCYRNCPVANQARQVEDDEDPVHPFFLQVKDKAGKDRRLHVSMFAVAAVRPALSAVVHVVRENGSVPPAVEKELAQAATEAPAPRWPMTGSSAGNAVELTTREKEILRCLAEGLSTSAIAEKLFIAPVTVRNHVQSILQKLDVHTKLAAVVFAYRHQLI